MGLSVMDSINTQEVEVRSGYASRCWAGMAGRVNGEVWKCEMWGGRGDDGK